MTDVNNIYAEITLNEKKLTEFLKSVESDVKAGNLTLEEIKETIIDDLTEYFDVKVLKKKLI